MDKKEINEAAKAYAAKNTCYNSDPDLLRRSIAEAYKAGAEAVLTKQ